MRSLEEIYGVKKHRSLEDIYGVKTNTPTSTMSQGLDTSMLPTVDKPEGSVLAPLVESASNVATTIGGGVQNAIRAGGRALGANTPAQTTVPSLITGSPVDPVGYRGGQELGAMDSSLQGAGALAEGLSYGVGGGAVSEAANLGRAGVMAYLKPAVKTGAKAGFLQGSGASLQGGDGVPVALAKGVGTAVLGAGLGAVTGGVGALNNKLKGYSPEIFSKLDDAVRSGDNDAVTSITSSPEYKAVLKNNKYDDTAVTKSVTNVRNEISKGIDNSYGVSKMTRAEKAEALTDDGIKAMMEHASNSSSPIGDTKLALQNKADDLMNDAMNPIIDKIRNENLPLVPLDRPSLISSFNSKLDKSLLTDADKIKIRGVVDNLINVQNAGNDFGVVDAGILRRNANINFDNEQQKGAVSRMLGDTMREALTAAEKNATDPQTKAIIAHINAVNKEYSRLMKGVEVVDLLAKFPGQKPSELLNKAAGLLTAGHTGGNPIAYLGAHKITNALQTTMTRAKNNKLFGDLSGKSGPITSSELIGNAQRILNNISDVSGKDKSNKFLQSMIPKQKMLSAPTEGSPISTNNIPVQSRGASSDASRGFADSKPLNSNLKGMIDTNVLNKTAGATAGAVGAMAGYNKLADTYGKETYTREQNQQPIPASEKPVDPVVNQIAHAETRGEKDPYSFSQWSNKNLGPGSPLGKALGKYQVTEARLREKSQDFLGYVPTPSEFLKSPSLQDAFISAQVAWQKAQGLSDDEVLATHRRGWGNLQPDQIKKALSTSKDYISMAKTGK